MTDQELSNRLRKLHLAVDCRIAADRIEKLVESIKNLSYLWVTVAVNLEVSEGKLEKAVEFIQEVRRNGDTRLASMAIAVLSELE